MPNNKLFLHVMLCEALIAIFLLTSCTTSVPRLSSAVVDTHTQQELFSEALFLVVSEHIDAPDPQFLVGEAIRAMMKKADPLCSLTPQDVIIKANAIPSGPSSQEQLKIFNSVFEWIQGQYSGTLKPEDAVYAAISGMMEKADHYGSFIPRIQVQEMLPETKNNFGGIGIELKKLDQQMAVIAVIEGTPAERAKIRPGDVIFKIDGKPTSDMTLNTITRNLRGLTGTRITVSILRDGVSEPIDMTLIREPITLKSVQCFDLGNGVQYIRIKRFDESAVQKMVKLQTTKTSRIILDLRNNSGGLLDAAVRTAEMFLDSGQLITHLQGRYEKKDIRFITRDIKGFAKSPMVVLINDQTSAGAEIVAAAFQDWKRAIILGVDSFGARSTQTAFPLSDGSQLRITTHRFLAPKSQPSIDGKVRPDIVVQKSPENLISLRALVSTSSNVSGLDTNSDLQLQRALELIREIKYGE